MIKTHLWLILLNLSIILSLLVMQELLCEGRRFGALTPAPLWGSPCCHPSPQLCFQEIIPKVKFLQLSGPQQGLGISLLSPSIHGSGRLLMGSPLSFIL